MSKKIDERVVEMKFDNRQFESNVKTSMSTLDKLKQSLNFKGLTKGLDSVNAAAKKTDFSGMNQGVQEVTTKFSALQIAGVTALANITNSAVNAGKRLVSALTIDPIISGFREYETQIGAVQTILANTQSKGSTLTDVNRALDELNHYADQTIYNFTEMTKNIGTFTAAGVDLDKSVTSIKGIANLAAVSGSTSMQASQAMYQLSQALATGKVSLMDWNSVVNAGMGGEVFQTALKRTAENMGTDVDALIEKYGSFRDSLTQGQWLTADVLTETLTQLSGAYTEADLLAQGYTKSQAKEILELADTAVNAATKVKTFTQLFDTLGEALQSGWTQSWEIILGDFNEAQDMFTDISETLSNAINDSANARNEILMGGLSSGWKQLLNEGINDEEKFIDTVKNVAKEHGVSVDKMLKDGTTFEQSLKDGWLSSDMLVDSVNKYVGELDKMSSSQLKSAGYTIEQVNELKEFAKQLSENSSLADEFTNKMKNASGREKVIEGLWNVFKGLANVLNVVRESFREIFPPMTADQLYDLTVKFKELTSQLKLSDGASAALKSTFKGIFTVVKFVADAFGVVLKVFGALVGLAGDVISALFGITGGIGEFVTGMGNAVSEAQIFESIGDGIVNIINGIRNGLQGLGGVFESAFESLDFENISGFFQKIFDVVSGLGSAIGDAFSSITGSVGNSDFFDILNGGLFAGMLVGLNKFIFGLSKPFEMVGGTFREIVGILDGVRECFAAYQETLKANALLKIAGAIAILAAAILVISTIDSDSLVKSLGALTVLFVELNASLGILSKIDLAGITGTITAISTMIGMSTAILILASALKKLSSLDWSGIAKGLVGVGGLMAELMLFLQFANFGAMSMRSATSIVILSSALIILSQAVKNLGSLDLPSLAKGLGSIAALLLTVVGFSKLMEKTGSFVMVGASMILLATSVKIFASAIQTLGSMSLDSIGRGLLAMGGALAEVVIAMRLMPNNLAITGTGLVIVAGALTIMADAMSSFGSMSFEQIGSGLLVMGGALAELAIALNLMNGTLRGSAALVIASAALAMMAPAIKLLGSLSLDQVATALIAVAGAFVVVGVAGQLLTPLVPTLIALSAAFAIFGVGIAAIGAGVALIGVGITSIAAGIAALAAALSVGATTIVAGLQAIILGIIDTIPAVAVAIAEAIVTVFQTLGQNAPILVESLLQLILGVLNSLATYAPQIVDALLNFIIGIINSLAEHIPDLIVSVMNFVGALFQGIVDALSSIDPTALLQGVVAIGLMAGVIAALSAIVPLIPSAMIAIAGLGVIAAELAVVLAALGGLAQIPGLQWLISEGGNLLQSIGTAIGQFVGGLIGGIAEGATSTLPQVAKSLSDFMTNLSPFIEGAKSLDSSMMDGVTSLVQAIVLLTGANVLDKVASFITGGSSLSSFAEQLVPFGEAMAQYGQAVSGIDPSVVTASAFAANALAQMASNLPNSGGVAGFFAGENDLGDFANQLVPFGAAMKSYSQAVSGIDAGAIEASATAGKALSELASSLPNSGGVAGFFAGENDLGDFAKQLIPFGLAMKMYSQAVVGLDAGAIQASAAAGKALSELANSLPNTGGLVSLFTGDNSISGFAKQLIPFGTSMKEYSAAVSGLDAGAVIASAMAGQALAQLANNIPNVGGLVSAFTGEKNLASFGQQLIPFGTAMKMYSIAVTGINAGAVMSSAVAGQALAQLANTLPNTGGLISFVTGQKDLGSFGQQLIPFGMSMKLYSIAVTGFNAEAVMASAVAGQALVQLANTLPNTGGLIEWFTGGKDLAEFGAQLIPFGTAMKMYSIVVTGFNAEAVLASASAGHALVQLANTLPNTGGLISFFTGDKDLAGFAQQLIPFGFAMKMYSTAVTGFNEKAVLASASAGKALVELNNTLPNTGGLFDFFTGDKDLAGFAQQLIPFGFAMKMYSVSVVGLNQEAITNSVTAATSLIDLMNQLKNSGGLFESFTGKKDLAGFAQQLIPFGIALRTYSVAVVGIDPVSVSASADAGKKIVELINSTDGIKTGGVSSFVQAINTLGTAQVDAFVNSFSGASTKMTAVGTDLTKYLVQGLNSGLSTLSSIASNMANTTIKAVLNVVTSSSSSAMSAGAGLINGFIAGIKNGSRNLQNTASSSAKLAVSAFLLGVSGSSSLGVAAGAALTNSFARGIRNGVASVRSAVSSLVSASTKSTLSVAKTFSKVGGQIGTNFAKGLRDKKSSAISAVDSMGKSMIVAAKSYYSDFYDVGSYLVSGMKSGISANDYKVAAQARAMAKAASDAARSALDINSPSKVFRKIGYSVPEGFAQGIDRMSWMVEDSSVSMGDMALGTMSNTISRISDAVNSDIDTQPTIRPVLDLSNVENGAGAISSMLSSATPLGVLSEVNGISRMMNQRSQNGVNDEVVRAINKLRNDVGNMSRPSYNINGITYDDGSNISNAVRDIVRAARVERRS